MPEKYGLNTSKKPVKNTRVLIRIAFCWQRFFPEIYAFSTVFLLCDVNSRSFGNNRSFCCQKGIRVLSGLFCL